VWIQKKNFSIETEPRWFSLGLALILFVGLSVIKTFMAFELEPNVWSSWIPLIIIHQISVLAGIMAMWFGADKVIKWFTQKEWFNYASGFSFFIFGLHVPLLPYVMNGLMNSSMIPISPQSFFTLCFCSWVGSMLRRFVPKVYAVMTGGRGF
jgi:hypothetical protein